MLITITPIPSTLPVGGLVDHEGSIRDVVRLDNSDVAIVENHIIYNSFGNIVDQTDDTETIGSYYYTGQEFDAETGLYYYNARYYDPTIGRFISQDPMSFDAGDTNLYRYVGNNPMTFTDPTGMCWSGVNSSTSSYTSSSYSTFSSGSAGSDISSFSTDSLGYSNYGVYGSAAQSYIDQSRFVSTSSPSSNYSFTTMDSMLASSMNQYAPLTSSYYSSTPSIFDVAPNMQFEETYRQPSLDTFDVSEYA